MEELLPSNLSKLPAPRAQSIRLLASQLDTSPIAFDLATHPEVWDTIRLRTTGPSTPHVGASDVWVRYADTYPPAPGPHESVWYPAAAALPSIRLAAHALMYQLQGERLGGILVTRVRAGQRIAPHTDNDWHANYYDKFALQVAAHPQQRFCYHGESLVTAAGDLYWFENQSEHWVENPSPVDRITVIFCIRLPVPGKPFTLA